MHTHVSAQACCCDTGTCLDPGHYACFPDCTCQRASPIIVDTLGKGFHLTTAESGVRFDIAGVGHPIQMAWSAENSGNAFLALDRNGNGKIDNGKELFGNFTDQPKSDDPNGFLALAEFDKPENGGNGDGIIDQRDAIYSHLLLWIDENHDGISQPNELHTLPELGVFSLALKYKESRRTDEFGNQFRYKAAVNPNPKDGESKDGRWAFDVFFMIDPDTVLPPLQEGLNPGPKHGQAQCLNQVPTASRIVSPVSSYAINSGTSPACPGGQAGWYRRVQKIVTDQDGADITLAAQLLTEVVTLGSRNDLRIGHIDTSDATTIAGGYFDDQLKVCSPVCPGNTGETDATQNISDVLPTNGISYPLNPNGFKYTCKGNYINGQ